jgi:protein-L-isoaspartate(D-aspartate) O-methyltransferase
MIDFQSARLNMVDSQVRPNKVTDLAVLDAMLVMPREIFAPQHLHGVAYIDEDVPVGGGRFLIEPMVFGRLLQIAAIGLEDTVLDIGCGTGYAAAVMSRLARSVVALDDDSAMIQRAGAACRQLGLANVAVVEGPLAQGYAQRGPYHVITFGGAIASVPPAVSGQLAEGGRLLAVIKPEAGMGKAVLMTRRDGVLAQRVVFDAGTPLLPGFAAEPEFVF